MRISRPMGNVIGRQPSRVYIAPSQSYPWYGEIVGAERVGFDGAALTGGDRFTTQQQVRLIARGFDVPTIAAILVRRNATSREMWWGPDSLPPVYEFECPVVHRRADGRVRIIAPNGDEKLVEGDGWTTPHRKRGWGGSRAA